MKTKRNRTIRFVALTMLSILVFMLCLSSCGSSNIKDAPFMGIEHGFSPEKVKSMMGTPHRFQDNGLNNFNYYYHNISFLGEEGTLRIHFELDMVSDLCYRYQNNNAEEMTDFAEEVSAFLSNKYGDATYYYEGDNTYATWWRWELDDGYILDLEYKLENQESAFPSDHWLEICRWRW